MDGVAKPSMKERNAFSIVSRHARERPHAPALTGFGRSWTYAELAAQAERVAGALSRLCSEPGARVGVVADNHPLTCVVHLAAARAGMMVSLLNSRFKAPELAVVLAKLRPQILIHDAAHRLVMETAVAEAGVDPALATLERLSGSGLPAVEDWTDAEPFTGPLPNDDDHSEISWTSGTTSSPKGVVLTHDTAIFRAECERELFRLGETDAAAVITPLFHQSGIRNTVLVMWVCGGHAVVLPRFDPATFWADMVRYRITYLCMVETILLMLERNPPGPEERQNTLRTVLAASEPDVIKRCEERFGIRVVQVWGMTENGVATGVPMSIPLEEVRALREWGRGSFLAGWPASPDTEIRLVAEGEPVMGEGATGEIQIASKLLFSQYFEDPEATAKTFDGKWMMTGDLGRYGPGNALYFLDRIKDVIRRGGENIASTQVEEVLRSHPAVRQAAIVPVPDPLFMQEVKAVIVADGKLSPAEIWTWCEDRLADYKVPRYVEFRDALPVNGNGRVQKHVLVAPDANAGHTFDRRAEKVPS